MTPDEYCQQKAAASGSSFYYSFLFLPPARRRAITALYAFCREVDDVVDEVRDPSLAQAKLAWELLAVASTFAGNLTLLGSVANVIVAEQAHAVGGLPFWAHLKVGLPLALLTTAMGTAWLLLVG